MEDLPSEDRSDTLDPLPNALLKGLPVVAFSGLLSLATSGLLFVFLTYRLLRWYINGGLEKGINQFLLLIYNLLFADIQQAIAFSLTAVYLADDKIDVSSKVCWANGWFVSIGDLATGVFILSIALHTFLGVTLGYKPSNRALWLWIAAAWAFVYGMAIIGIGIDSKLFVRAGAWCWIDRKYKLERLVLHYLWIFICMSCTVILYMLIFTSIKSKLRRRHIVQTEDSGHEATYRRAARLMTIFPAAYVFCTLPLAGGRMAAMTGVQIPYWYYCFAGAAITSCGWLDVLLYALTRRAIVFSKEPPATSDFGLEAFGWRLGGGHWGTTTTIEGPLTRTNAAKRGVLFANGEASLYTRSSDEEYFACPGEGVIATKTTVEVHAELVSPCADSNTSVIELEG